MGFFTIIGMTLLVIKSSAILYISFTIIGVILATYGVFVILKARQLKKKRKNNLVFTSLYNLKAKPN